jgi:hypothetical protein
MSPYWVANAALLCWPLVAIVLFARLSLTQATIWTILGGFLLLPADAVIKFGMIPQLDKNSVPNLCALAGCIATGGNRFRLWSRFGAIELLILIYLLVPIATSAQNGDPVIVGDTFLPGVGLYDAISTVISQTIGLIPLILGRQLIRSDENLTEVFHALVVGALLYSVLMLIEVRMSPQVSVWVYGFSASSFVNEMRYGGYRPVVFMSNGLILAFFVMTAVVAAVMLWRAGIRIGRWSAGAAASFLGFVLVLCKSAGALLNCITLVALVLLTTVKTQARVAVALAILALAYPVLKANDIFPDRALINIAKAVNDERAQSLETRFDQEAILLEHSSERFLFGWGRFGRNRVYDSTGKDTTITDGLWIITLSTFGLVGFLAEFGLLALPVFKAARALRMVTSPAGRAFLAVLMLIVAASLVEQLPNASLTPWMWFLVGGLDGRSELLRSSVNRGSRRIGHMIASPR